MASCGQPWNRNENYYSILLKVAFASHNFFGFSKVYNHSSYTPKFVSKKTFAEPRTIIPEHRKRLISFSGRKYSICSVILKRFIRTIDISIVPVEKPAGHKAWRVSVQNGWVLCSLADIFRPADSAKQGLHFSIACDRISRLELGQFI